MFSHRILQRLLGAIFILLTIIPAAGAATPLHKVVFVFAGFNERTGYIFVAKDLRFFEEQGLDAQIVQVRNGQVAVSALAANEAQFYSVSATGASLGAMAAGLDLAFIAGIVNKLDGDFVVAPKIAAWASALASGTPPASGADRVSRSAPASISAAAASASP